MRVFLSIEPASTIPEIYPVECGVKLIVGSELPAQVRFSNDPMVSCSHFAIEFDGSTCRLLDLGSKHGTFLNGARVSEAILGDFDLIRAGMTMLRVRFEEESVEDAGGPAVTVPSDAAAEAEGAAHVSSDELTVQEWAIRELRASAEPLYALVDAARDPLVLALLLEADEKYASLYEGPKGDRLASSAPYLVALPTESAFLATLVDEGWGNSWGVYLRCDKPFDEVRKHLRHFLLVDLDGQKPVYFRYYDPRVLRPFLPSCTPQETAEFFGPIRSLSMESEGANAMLTFELHGGTIQRRELKWKTSDQTIR
jgi:hypothetical protein